MHGTAHGGVQTPKGSVHWKLTVGEKSHSTPGDQTCDSGVPVRYSYQLSYIPAPLDRVLKPAGPVEAFWYWKKKKVLKSFTCIYSNEECYSKIDWAFSWKEGLYCCFCEIQSVCFFVLIQLKKKVSGMLPKPGIWVMLASIKQKCRKLMKNEEW